MKHLQGSLAELAVISNFNHGRTHRGIELAILLDTKHNIYVLTGRPRISVLFQKQIYLPGKIISVWRAEKMSLSKLWSVQRTNRASWKNPEKGAPGRAVRDFDEKTCKDKQKTNYFETMECFLGLRKYLYFFCKCIVLNMKIPLCYIIIIT